MRSDRRNIPADAEVLYVDDAIVAVNKPPGVSLDVSWDDAPTVIERLAVSGAIGPDERLVSVYLMEPRLSGVAILARTRDALENICAQRSDGSIEMYCLALVRGRVSEAHGEIAAPIRPRAAGESVLRIDAADGEAATTRWQRLDGYVGAAQLECVPQPPEPDHVRLHLQHAGMPLMVDRSYGGGAELRLSQFKAGYRPSARRPERPLMERVSLHVRRVVLNHPANGRRLTFEASLHKDFRAAIYQLDRFGRLPT